MVQTLDRRTLLSLALAANAATLMGAGGPAASQGGPAVTALDFGPPAPFSYEGLKERARALAARPYQPPPRPDLAIVSKIDYDAHGKLLYRPEFALFDRPGSAYPITFKHVGMFFPKTVRMYAVEDGNAREIIYHPEYFTIGNNHVAAGLPPVPSAFAGFWVQETRSPSQGGPDWRVAEPWATFLGASYFRAIGELGQVGISARGVALSPGASGPEEFPDFVAFWFEPAPAPDAPVTVYALLDGPSLTGAFRFLLRRGQGVLMDVENELTLRAPVDRLGIAPFSSMFWYSETIKPTAIDWRPEVHDSDGLAIWTGTGERIWRPLNNPAQTKISSFMDEDPRGFGLLQRDRVFGHYLDGVRYHLRPSTWVEPLGAWGKGSVQLVEIPTDDEIHDNIVATWVPAGPTRAGDRLAFQYRLHWLADEPFPTPLARVVATRLGRGGQPGQPRPRGVGKIMVEFLGGPLTDLPFGVVPEPVIWLSRGSLGPYRYTEAVPNDVPGHWRTQFDVIAEGSEPVELRLFLTVNGQTASETWLYQYHPADGARF